MSTTIASLRADVILNTAKAEGSAKKFEGNLRQLRSTLNRLETAEEKQERQLQDLKKAQQAGIISTDQLAEAQRRLEKNTRGSTKVLRDQGQGLRGFGAGFLGGGGLTAVAALGAGYGLSRAVGSHVDQLTTTGDMAARIGASAAGLRGLQEAGMMTGVNAQTMAMALQRMTRRISEAATGTGTAVKALDELGLSAKTLAQLRPEQQFAELADAFKEIQNPSDQLRNAFALFDSEGTAVINTLREHTKEQLLGIGDDFKEAFSDENVDNARQLAANLQMVNTEINTLKMHTINFFTPFLTGILDVVNSLARRETPGQMGRATLHALQNNPANLTTLGLYGHIASRLGFNIGTDPRTNRQIHGPIDRTGKAEELQQRYLKENTDALRQAVMAWKETNQRGGNVTAIEWQIQDLQEQRNSIIGRSQ